MKVCAVQGCGTVLSRYNRLDVCWQHTPDGARLPRQRISPLLDGHGTYGGCQRHRRKGEVPCDECKAAAREYQRAWAARNLTRARRPAALAS